MTIIDQLTKVWAVSFLEGKGSVEVFGKFLMLTLIYNEGGALGTSFGPSFYYLITSLLILVFVIYYLFSHRTNKMVTIPLAFIAGGALGNIIDRLRLDKVIDWIDVDFFDINIFNFHLERWWTFNIADSVISCSILFILLSALVTKFSESEKEKDPLNSDINKLSETSLN